MSSTTHLIQRRRRKREETKKLFSSGLISALIISLSLAVCGLWIATTFAELLNDLPSIEQLPVYMDAEEGTLFQPTRIYDQTGNVVLFTFENPAITSKRYLYFPSQESLESSKDALDFIPANLVAATMAAFDPSFWEHQGYSLKGLLNDQPSTLAQRLAAEILLINQPSGIEHALKERILAAQIAQRYGKEKIIEWYLNSAHFGNWIYGAEAAAQYYFGKHAAELTLSEAATLIAIAEEPWQGPYPETESVLTRQKEIIQKMLQYQFIKPEEGIEAIKEEPEFVPRKPISLISGKLDEEVSPSFITMILQQLEAIIPLETLRRGGYRVITSLDYTLQEQVNCALTRQIARLKDTNPEEENSCKAGLLLPTLVDSLGTNQAPVQGEAIILDPHSGQIIAFASTEEYGATWAGIRSHPVGSITTPFIYLTAFTRGLSPASLVWDIPPPGLPGETITNFDGQYHGPVRLRIALANDYLPPVLHVTQQVGAENIWRLAQQLEVVSKVQPFEPTLSGNNPFLFNEASLLQIAKGYAVLANRGAMAGITLPDSSNQKPDAAQTRLTSNNSPVLYGILRVESASEEVVSTLDKESTKPIITPELAYLMTNVLSDETARWESLGHPNALEIGRPAAVKLGQTHSGNSAWCVGYVPQLLVGVWIGLDPPEMIAAEKKEVIDNAVAGLWHALMQFSTSQMSVQNWEIPAGISNIEVCDPSGLLPTADCSNTVEEVFLQGTEPTHGDTLYHKVQINSLTNKLATVFTPPEFIMDKVYLSIPPEAYDWAQNAGFELPPENYDAIPANLPYYEQAHISQPNMFDFVHGKISITGSAYGDTFDAYRLHYGAGLNPRQWFLIEENDKSIREGELGVWDTQGLDGLYVLQLVVINQDRNVKRVNLLVTIDNQPPVITSTYPFEGSRIELLSGNRITIRADIQDNLGIASVKFYIDGKPIMELAEAPYAFTWLMEKGKHTLRVVTTDLAGNQSEVKINFIVE